MKASARFLRQAAALLTAALLALPAGAEEDPWKREALRRPVALGFCDGKLLCANRDRGSVSLIELDPPRVSSEQKIGRRLEDL